MPVRSPWWFIEVLHGDVIAGPYVDMDTAVQYGQRLRARLTAQLVVTQRWGFPWEPTAILDSWDDVTPALRSLQASGDVILVALGGGFVGIYQV